MTEKRIIQSGKFWILQERFLGNYADAESGWVTTFITANYIEAEARLDDAA